jgi:hypothetical protein
VVLRGFEGGCLRTMEMGSELSRTVATFIVHKILLDDVSVQG